MPVEKTRLNSILIIILCLFTAGASGAPLEDEPLAIFLTWKEDPTTTISIDWHSFHKQDQKLFYREKGSMEWKEVKSQTHHFPFSDRFIHRVFLNGLKAGTSYEIMSGRGTKQYYFNTMHSNTIEEPVVIAIDGDTMAKKKIWKKQTSRY